MSIRTFLPTGGNVTPMQLLIFIQLLEGSKYGYEILKNLRNDFDGIWSPKTGTVYPALKSLVKKGFISEKDRKDTTYYSITDAGMEQIRDTKSLVREYVLFNYQFMTIAVQRLPADFTMSMLVSLHELGIDDIIPERTIVEAIKGVPDKEVRQHILEGRKRVLLDKLQVIRDELKTIEEN